jgi:hypothetical protein
LIPPDSAPHHSAADRATDDEQSDRNRMKLPSLGHDARVNTLICCGHTLSHFYILMMPTMFLAWQQAFGVSFA